MPACARLRFAAALCALLAGTGPAMADIAWGVNGHPIKSYPGVSIAEQLDLVQDLGTRSYRVDVPDLAAADRLAELVTEARRRGLTILPVLTPAVDLEKRSESALYEEARSLARTLGTRFRDDIRVWELGNEMENFAIIKPCEPRDDGTIYPCEWGPAGGTGVLDYYGPRWRKVSAVLRGLSDGIAEADPTIRRAMGTAGWGHTGAFERMQADGIAWDISVWHMYGEDPEWAFEQLARYGKPIWVTEFNHPGGSQGGAQAQADGLVKTMQRLRDLETRFRIEEAHIYELLDETYWAPHYEAYMGLVELGGSAAAGWTLGKPKPAYAAVRRFIGGNAALPQGTCDSADIQRIADTALRTTSLAYCIVLGRNVDPAEAEPWTRTLKDGGLGAADMVAAMLGSEEFRQKHQVSGMDDRSYIDLLYRLLLGRPADGGGLDSYEAQLRDGAATRETIAKAIVQSGEFSARHALQ